MDHPAEKRRLAARRLRSQLITRPRFAHPSEVVSWLGAVQAQDYPASLWAVGLRTSDASEAEVEQAIADRTIVRTWPMRGTIHLVAAPDVRWMLSLLTPRVIARQARRFQELGLDESVVARSRTLITKALQGGKQLERGELYQLLEDTGISTADQRGYHLLSRFAMDGLICFGAREGKQHTFALLDEWIPEGRSLSRDEALAELTRRYFASHGPATLQDFVWWSGLAAADARAGLEIAGSRLGQATVDDEVYWASPDPPSSPAEPDAVYLLPPFDEYLVGYRNRAAVLDPSYAKQAHPGGGILNATLVIEGQVAGTWKRTVRRGTTHLTITSFWPLHGTETAAVAAAANRYGQFLNMPVEVESAALAG